MGLAVAASNLCRNGEDYWAMVNLVGCHSFKPEPKRLTLLGAR
jgi:hypothetical protein